MMGNNYLSILLQHVSMCDVGKSMGFDGSQNPNCGFASHELEITVPGVWVG